MAEGLSFEAAAEQLQAIYVSPEYNELIKKRSQTTYLEAIGKQRSETIFSSLIKWIIDNKDFNKESESSPLMFLLRLLALTAVKQELETPTDDKKPIMDYDLRNRILVNDIVLHDIKGETEETTSSDKGNGRIDLVVKCKVQNRKGEDLGKLRILLENKVDSEEGKNKDNNKNQCKKYFDHYTNGDGYKQDIKYNIFVFLSIAKPKDISDKHFIKITYQELLDNVLNQIMVQSICYPDTSVRYLKDFIDTLTTLNTGGNRNIAVSEETRSLLSEFYRGNKDIIDAAVLAGCKSKAVTDAILESQSQKDLTKYNIYVNGKQVNKKILPKSQVAVEALKAIDVNSQTPSKVISVLNSSNSFWFKDEGTVEQPENTVAVDINGDTYYVWINRTHKDNIQDLTALLGQVGVEIKPAP